MVTIAKIPRPLGIVLEERTGGGVEVIAINPRGNAVKAGADVLVGDRVLMVDASACARRRGVFSRRRRGA